MSNSTPKHIAIIMDGNGRWAKKRGLPRMAGHKKGADSAREIIETCSEVGVPYLTLYAFSSENWKRPAEEVENLMELLKFYLGSEIESLNRNGVRIRFIGNRGKLSDDIQNKLKDAEKLTENNNKLNLTIALSYGSREEIVIATRAMAEEIASGKIVKEDIDEQIFSKFLYTIDIPDPDLLIRTGGEQRLSNFLLWQAAYTELFFTDILWPDFGRDNLLESVGEYSRRERRYGTS